MGVGSGCSSDDGTHTFVVQRYDDPGEGNGPVVEVLKCCDCNTESRHEVGPSR